MAGFNCVGFTPKIIGNGENCGNCENYTGTSCLVRKTLDEVYGEEREIERLMRHDAYRRESGGIRQTRHS